MLPSIDLRIENLLKALQQVVIPAIPKRERLAHDQALLIVGHLQMISVQWKSALKFESQSLDELLGLASKLHAAGHIGMPAELKDRLGAAIAASLETDRLDASHIEAALMRLGGVIDEIILSDDTQDPIPSELTSLVLDYGKYQSWRERCWFQNNNLDPEHASLPSIAAMLAKAGEAK